MCPEVCLQMPFATTAFWEKRGTQPPFYLGGGRGGDTRLMEASETTVGTPKQGCVRKASLQVPEATWIES